MSVPLAVEGMDAIALAQEGERLCRENNLRAGIKYLEMALEKMTTLGNQGMEALSAIYSQLGNAYFALRNFNKALEYHQYDLNITRSMEDKSGLAKAHANIGNTYKAMGEFDSAHDHAVAHLRLAQELKDKECEAKSLYNLASIYHCRAKLYAHSAPRHDESSLSAFSDQNATSQLQAAINCYMQNLRIVEERKDLAACGRTYGNLGNSFYMLGDHSVAVEYYNKRLDIARQFGDRAAMRRAYTNLGNAYIFLAKTSKAIEYYRLALSLTVELNDMVTEAQCCFNVGSGCAISGDYSTAVEFHTRHLTLARKLRDLALEARAYRTLVDDYASLGDVGKTVYFFIMQYLVASKLSDSAAQVQTRLYLEEFLRAKAILPTDRNSISVPIDSSGDPEPRLISELSSSLKYLLFDSEQSDCGISRRSTDTQSMLSLANDERCKEELHMDDDFFDLISRIQSKRINDQRCDPIILSDMTNRSKGVTRQSDTLTCNIVAAQDQRIPRLSNLIGRLGKAARNSLPFSSSLPNTILEDDISQIIMKMQKGRIEAQRANLSPSE